MVSHIINQIPKNDEIGQIIQNHLEYKYCKKYVLIGKDETCLPVYYEQFADNINHFEVHNNDVFICTFPKSGTTWTQEMVWLIINDLDYEGAKTILSTRFPFFELSITHNYENMAKDVKLEPFDLFINSIAYISRKQEPRFIKSHLPFPLLPNQIKNGTKSPKIIYVLRDSRDVCVSFYHHGKLFQGWRSNMEDHCKVFMTNKIMYGSYWKHIFGFWSKRHLPNLLFITYEDMKRDLASVIKKVASFLDKKLIDNDIENLCKHLHFESMKKNDSVNLEPFVRSMRTKKLLPEDGEFIRSGVTGKYKEEISPEMLETINVWINENISDTSLAEEYPYLL